MKTSTSFRQDGAGFPLAYVDFTDRPVVETKSERPTRDRARQLAVNIAKLPELLQRQPVTNAWGKARRSSDVARETKRSTAILGHLAIEETTMTDYRTPSDDLAHRHSHRPDPVVVEQPTWLKWAPWVIGGLILLLLLSTLGRSHQPTQTVSSTTTASATRGGGSELGSSLQSYLATNEAPGRRFIFDDLHFATGSAALPTEAASTISEIARVLVAFPASQVRIDGYADARPSAPGNVELGAARARAVGAALVAFGVAPERITTATGGDSNPVAPNATMNGQAENRRTELVITSK